MRGLDSFDIDIKQCWVELKEFEKSSIKNAFDELEFLLHPQITEWF